MVDKGPFKHSIFTEVKNSFLLITGYTDGSCHPQSGVGTWASILFADGRKILLQGSEKATTHNRMELLAAINSIRHLDMLGLSGYQLLIYSDSQYLVNLLQRKEKLKANRFITRAGKAIQNEDLVRILIEFLDAGFLSFIKVKAHQKDGDPLNREVDLLVRAHLRDETALQNEKQE